MIIDSLFFQAIQEVVFGLHADYSNSFDFAYRYSTITVYSVLVEESGKLIKLHNASPYLLFYVFFTMGNGLVRLFQVTIIHIILNIERIVIYIKMGKHFGRYENLL